VPHDAVAFGEVALSGELRPAGLSALRLKEAAKLGFTRALVPASTAGGGAMKISSFKTLGGLVEQLVPQGE
jgi:DNA repair protein RadA/Sms